jgi:predicted amidohydrolase YtcJ
VTTILRDVRILQLDGRPPERTVDVRVEGGAVAAVGPGLATTGVDAVLDADGRWLAPGLWDGHVHMAQWAQSRVRLDLRPATSAADALRLVREHVAGLGEVSRDALVTGWGHRSAAWSLPPTVPQLDAASDGRPVVLISGDGHHGWLNTRAQVLLGVAPRDTVVEEAQWFAVFGRLGDLAGAAAQTEAGLRTVLAEAAAMGVVGVVDLEFAGTIAHWPDRVAAGLDTLRVRVGTYPAELDLAIATGLSAGMPLPGSRGLVTMGPLKVISDGSLNTRTAYCCEPFADADAMAFPRGKPNLGVQELHALMARAHAHGLECAIHAIGDQAVSDVLDVFAATGARGSVEHAQLVAWADVDRLARLGVRASVQPAHLLDDRDLTMQCWPDRGERCFAFRRMLDAGVRLVLGSDAPVSPLDPWLAMSAAVWRSADEREPWHPEQALTARQAYAASTDGQGTVAVGSRADLVLLDADPTAAGAPREQAQALRSMVVSLTMVGGRIVHSTC